jgi:hypothetical protein
MNIPWNIFLMTAYITWLSGAGSKVDKVDWNRA